MQKSKASELVTKEFTTDELATIVQEIGRRYFNSFSYRELRALKDVVTELRRRRGKGAALELHKAGCDSYEEQQARIEELKKEKAAFRILIEANRKV